jgi:acyl carrier protein
VESEIARRVDKVLRAQLGDGFTWTSQTSLTDPINQDGLDLDSLDMVEFVMGLEEEFGTEIPDQDLDLFSKNPAWATVGDAVAWLERTLEAKPALRFA